MILKGLKSEQLEKFFDAKQKETIELENYMKKMGHSSFAVVCPHHLVIETPDGFVPSKRCACCGQEIV